MSNLQSVSISLAAASSNNICLSQAPNAGGVQSLSLNGSTVSNGVAVLDTARRIQITSSGNDSSNTFVITGIRRNISISESITGPNTTSVSSVLDYDHVSSITISGNSVGNITVGTNGKASSKWIIIKNNRPIFSVGLGVVLSSGANLTYQVEHCFFDTNSLGNPNDYTSAITTFNCDDSNLVGATSNQNTNYAFPVSAIRLTTTAYTSGTATLNLIQAGPDL